MKAGRHISVNCAPAVGGAATGEDRTSRVTLDTLPPGVAARVISVSSTSSAVGRRLMEMGVVPGAPVRVIKTAPFNDPIEIRVRTYHLALRRAEAKTITVVTTGAE